MQIDSSSFLFLFFLKPRSKVDEIISKQSKVIIGTLNTFERPGRIRGRNLIGWKFELAAFFVLCYTKHRVHPCQLLILLFAVLAKVSSL